MTTSAFDRRLARQFLAQVLAHLVDAAPIPKADPGARNRCARTCSAPAGWRGGSAWQHGERGVAQA